MYFGKDNIAYCGFPTEDGKNGTLVNREAELFTILSFCTEPELAWDYLKTCASYVDPAVGSEGTIPVLRDRYRTTLYITAAESTAVTNRWSWTKTGCTGAVREKPVPKKTSILTQ